MEERDQKYRTFRQGKEDCVHHSDSTIKANLGKHFLSKIRYMSDGGVFEKIQKINEQYQKKNCEKEIKNEIEFYQSK